MDRRVFIKKVFGVAASMCLAPPFMKDLFRPIPAPAVEPEESEILKLVNATLRDLGKPKFHEIATEAQRQTAMRCFLRKAKHIRFDTSPCGAISPSV